MNKKKILLYGITPGVGGIEEYLMNILRYSKNPKEKFGIVIFGDESINSKEIESLGVDAFYLHNRNTDFYDLFIKCRDQYDTIYFNTSGLINIIPYVAAKMLGYYLVLHSHAANAVGIKRLFHFVNRKIAAPLFDKRLACSDTAASWMFGEKKDYVFIPNAISLDKCHFSQQIRDEIRGKMGIENNTIVIGDLARLTVVKNQAFLIRVIKEILDSGANNYLLMLVGEGDREPLRALAAQLNVENKVVFERGIENAAKFYNVFDFFASPSLFEGLPITTVEAQAYGLPSFLSDRITKQANITEDVVFLGIDDPKEWAKTIISSDVYRYDKADILRKKGFEISDLPEYVYDVIRKQ